MVNFGSLATPEVLVNQPLYRRCDRAYRMLSRNRGRRTDSRPTAVVVAVVATDAAMIATASGTWRQRRKMTDRNGRPQREEGSRLWVGKVGSGLGFGSEAAVGSR